ncbi:MAG: RNA polymerase sigma factor [Clostridiales bacterium]|jgi:RNA polymerase sigma-70 factor (ECF subfamily)|nr:RNA polymerase sigma factor [Clostridiales bacterium]
MPFFTLTGYDGKSSRMRRRVICEALIIRIGGNDKHALTQLYELTEHAVYAYILSIIQKPADTADLVQETYLCVRRSAHLYVPAGKPLPWLLSIARNLTNDYFRVHKRLPLGIGDLASDASIDRVPEIVDRIILRHALGILRSEERQVLFLHAVAGLRHREIAAYLSMPVSTVLTRYKHSVNKLKRRLGELGVSL